MANDEETAQLRAEILAALEEADLREGRYSDWTDETLRQLAAELKREARVMGNRDRLDLPTNLSY